MCECVFACRAQTFLTFLAVPCSDISSAFFSVFVSLGPPSVLTPYRMKSPHYRIAAQSVHLNKTSPKTSLEGVDAIKQVETVTNVNVV